ARLTDLEGQDAIDALADFSADNFVFEMEAPLMLSEADEVDLSATMMTLETVKLEVADEFAPISEKPTPEDISVADQSVESVDAQFGSDLILPIDEDAIEASSAFNQAINPTDGW
ncbi:MAG: hypothetical protein AAFP91_17345, partial [Pseudomonadota bacterium]